MNIIFFNNLDSTNNYAKSHIADLADKTVISTDIQTQGRGRFERTWVDLGKDNIFMTIILKPSNTFSETYSNLTQYLSVILCRQLEEMGLKPEIKWPNDVLLNEKKVCGILAETVMQGNNFKGLVLGIGVNLNTSKELLAKIDRPATAVNIELGREINKQEFMQNLLERFFNDYDSFLNNGFKSIKAEYKSRACFLNQELDVSIYNRIQSGFSKDLDDNGALILLDKEGKTCVINMGEIV